MADLRLLSDGEFLRLHLDHRLHAAGVVPLEPMTTEIAAKNHIIALLLTIIIATALCRAVAVVAIIQEEGAALEGEGEVIVIGVLLAFLAAVAGVDPVAVAVGVDRAEAEGEEAGAHGRAEEGIGAGAQRRAGEDDAIDVIRARMNATLYVLSYSSCVG
eukprot:scaffold37698_cov222-Skeletonema_dohrnii-CCMP3373.AAC.2